MSVHGQHAVRVRKFHLCCVCVREREGKHNSLRPPPPAAHTHADRELCIARASLCVQFGYAHVFVRLLSLSYSRRPNINIPSILFIFSPLSPSVNEDVDVGGRPQTHFGERERERAQRERGERDVGAVRIGPVSVSGERKKKKKKERRSEVLLGHNQRLATHTLTKVHKDVPDHHHQQQGPRPEPRRPRRRRRRRTSPDPLLQMTLTCGPSSPLGLLNPKPSSASSRKGETRQTSWLASNQRRRKKKSIGQTKGQNRHVIVAVVQQCRCY